MLNTLPATSDLMIPVVRSLTPDQLSTLHRDAKLLLAEADVFDDAEKMIRAKTVLAVIDFVTKPQRAPTTRQMVVRTNGGEVSFSTTLTDIEAEAKLANAPTDFGRKLFQTGAARWSEPQRAWAHKLALEVGKAPAGEWMGTVGQPLEVLVKVDKMVPRTGAYGPQTIVTFRSGDNVLTWFASGTPELEPGMMYNVRGTVKSHETFQGRKQTIITRVKKI